MCPHCWRRLPARRCFFLSVGQRDLAVAMWIACDQMKSFFSDSVLTMSSSILKCVTVCAGERKRWKCAVVNGVLFNIIRIGCVHIAGGSFLRGGVSSSL